MSDFPPQVLVKGRVDKVWTDKETHQITKLVVDGKWVSYSRTEKVPQPRPAEGSQVSVICNPWPADSDDPQLYIYKLTVESAPSTNGHAAAASPTTVYNSGPSVSPLESIRQTALTAAAQFLAMKPGSESIHDLLEFATDCEEWLLDPASHLELEPEDAPSDPIRDDPTLDSIPC